VSLRCFQAFVWSRFHAEVEFRGARRFRLRRIDETCNMRFVDEVGSNMGRNWDDMRSYRMILDVIRFVSAWSI
jgi:hypothetical protein